MDRPRRRSRVGPAARRRSRQPSFVASVGRLLTLATRSAEYKQVTVLFADVVHSMDIAAAVGCGAVARDHDRSGRPLRRWWFSATAARSGQFHRRRHDGGVRCANRVGGSRFPRLPWRRGGLREEAEQLALRCPRAGQCGAAVAGGLELRSGDCRGNGTGTVRLHRRLVSRSEWPSGWNRSLRLAG